MKGVLNILLNGIFEVGMTTVNSISRADTYEPEEDVELAEWVEKRDLHRRPRVKNMPNFKSHLNKGS